MIRKQTHNHKACVWMHILGLRHIDVRPCLALLLLFFYGESGARDVRHSGTHTMMQTDTGTSKGPHDWPDIPGPTATGCSRTACSLASPSLHSISKGIKSLSNGSG